MNISLENISFARDSKSILSDITLTIPDGEVTAVIGGNGCGKSTLLKIIAGLLRPDSGKISLDGTPLTAFSPAALARKRAIMLQNPNAPESMKAAELLNLSRYAYGDSNSSGKNAVDRAVNDVDCARWLDRPLGTLSGGEAKKVFFAMALAQEPELLLLDEIEAGVDAAFRSAFPALLRRLCSERSLTVVMVMHDLDLALHCADNILAVDAGKVNFFSPVKADGFAGKLHDFCGRYFAFRADSDGFWRAENRFD